MLKYNICFIKRGEEILLLNREKKGWMGCWNGVGGKLEYGEDLNEAIRREVFEETGINEDKFDFKGIVTWVVNGIFSGGMYVYTKELDETYKYETPKNTEEGILDFKNITWVLDSNNEGLASNIPYFLPYILNEGNPYEYRCYFEGENLIEVDKLPYIKDEKEWMDSIKDKYESNLIDYLGKNVEIKVDRPLGSKHPDHDFIYSLNYGYIPNTLSGDGEEVDAYILGVYNKVETFKGKVIAIIHRFDDNEDKLVVCDDNEDYSIEEIKTLTNFVERYFKSIIIKKN